MTPYPGQKHGHVTRQPVLARCGGPVLCEDCRDERRWVILQGQLRTAPDWSYQRTVFRELEVLQERAVVRHLAAA